MPNRLASEKSPYLLQHQDNPVEWYPWGEAAFEKSRRENKPIFLSIGYSTCHWCHVMAHESFEDEETARLMNELFVNIKVDREERPDVDKVYMAFVQMTTGGGGWPLSVFLTPERLAFFGGTYFPPHDQQGRPSFKSILRLVADRWRTDEKFVVQKSREGCQVMSDMASISAPSAKTIEDSRRMKWLSTCFAHFKSTFDTTYGEPKFPTPVNLMFLLTYHAMWKQYASEPLDHLSLADVQSRCKMLGLGLPASSDRAKVDEAWRKEADRNCKPALAALSMVLTTAEKMAAGGVYDHVGKGFHRYSVDRRWHVPHFEKMLYDQGQLLSVYAIAYQISRKEEFAQMAREIVEYVSSSLAHESGAFFCAEDADSLPLEGDKTKKGMLAIAASVLSRIVFRGLADVFCRHFGIRQAGNVPSSADPHGELAGQNVLIRVESIAATASSFKMSTEELSTLLAESLAVLREVRKGRPKPHLDDKILTSWNALMISGLCHAFHALHDHAYLDKARKAAEFIRNNLYRATDSPHEPHGLLRSYRKGAANIQAFSDDYAFLIAALLDLYEASLEPEWLCWARQLQEEFDEEFWDRAGLAYFGWRKDSPGMIMNLKDDHDGAEPCANSVAAKNLMRLSLLTGDALLFSRARQMLGVFSKRLDQYPFSMPALMEAICFDFASPRQIVISGPRDAAAFGELLGVVRERFSPFSVLLTTEVLELFASKETAGSFAGKSDKVEAHVCRDFVCAAPTSDPAELGRQLFG